MSVEIMAKEYADEQASHGYDNVGCFKGFKAGFSAGRASRDEEEQQFLAEHAENVRLHTELEQAKELLGIDKWDMQRNFEAMSNLCDQAEAERDKLRERVEGLLALLEEANDWLCEHDPEAIQMVQKHGMRGWCCGCSNYLRGEADTTLKARIKALLAFANGAEGA